jgi:hypothetical protein
MQVLIFLIVNKLLIGGIELNKNYIIKNSTINKVIKLSNKYNFTLKKVNLIQPLSFLSNNKLVDHLFINKKD